MKGQLQKKLLLQISWSFNISAKLIYSETKIPTENSLKLQSDLANGIYLVKVRLPDGSFDVHRLIINK